MLLILIAYLLATSLAVEVTILKVIDGDTLRVSAPWVPAPLKPEISLRVFGVDTPELKSKILSEKAAAERALQFTEQFLARGTVRVEYLRWDKYGGRIVGNVYVGEESLAAELISAGLGKPYYGGTKEQWDL